MGPRIVKVKPLAWNKGYEDKKEPFAREYKQTTRKETELNSTGLRK